MPQSKNVLWEIRDKGDIALCQKVGLEENGEVWTGKEEDLATRAIKVGKKDVLVNLFAGVKEDKTLLTTACRRGNAKHDWGVSQGRETNGGPVRRGHRRAAIERWDCSSWERSREEQDGGVP